MRDFLYAHALDQESIDAVVAAVEEAMTNAVRHSGATEDLEIGLCFEGTDLVAEVRDRGDGFDTASFDRERLPDPEEPGGRGLFLIAHLTDEMELHHDCGLHVRVLKRDVLPAHGARAAQAPMPGITKASDYWDVRQQTLFDEIEEAFSAIDWEYRYLYVNEAALRQTGKARDGVVGHAVREVFPLIPSAAWQAIRDAMELGRSSIVEFESPENGRWWELRTYPGSFGVSVYSRDIDERKRKELERDQSRRRSDLLARTASVLLSSADPLRQVEELCRAVMAEIDCQAFFNFVVDEAAGRLRLNAYHGIPEEAAQLIEWLDYGVAVCGCAARDACRIVAEEIPTTPDSRTDLVASYGIRAYAAHPLIVEGKVLGTLSFGTRTRTRFAADDLALMQAVADHVAIAMQRKRAEQALTESWTKYQALIETTGEFIWEMDAHGKYTYCSPQMETLWGLKPEEMIGRTPFDVMPAEGREAALRWFGRLLESPQPFSGLESTAVVAGGRLVSIETSGVPFFDNDGAFRGFRGVTRDITERKQAEQAARADAETTALLLEAAGTLTTSTSLAEVLDHLAQIVLQITSHARVTVSLWHEGLQRLEVATSRGDESVALGLQLTLEGLSAPARLAISDRKAVLVDYDALPKGSRGVGEFVTSHLALDVPMFAGDRLVGLVAVDDPGARSEFSEREVRLVEGLASQAVAAIENARLQDQLAESLRLTSALNDIAASVTTLLDHTEIMRVVAAQAGAALGAESASICTLEGDDWVPRYLWQLPEEVLGVPIPRDKVSYANVGVETRRAVAIDDCETDARVDFALQHSWNVRSVMMAPLVVRGKAIAGIFINYHSRTHAFTELEVDFIGRAAALISTALESARLFEAQRDLATKLQENLIHRLPAIDGLELAAVSLPAGREELIGGDFHDVFALPGGVVVALIGDVAGKGIKAAGLTETVRSAVRTLALISPSPDFILANVNRLLLHEGEHQQLVTALLLTLDVQTGRGLLASAGHPSAVLLSGRECRIIEPEYGLPLGAEEHSFAVAGFDLGRGEALVLYTDGLTEARRDGEMFGERRLLETLVEEGETEPAGLVVRLREAVLAFAGELRDDLQVLALRRT